MKRKEVLALEPNLPGRGGKVFTTQIAGDILVLNYWKNGKLAKRYCMNTETHEYETYVAEDHTWNRCKLEAVTDDEYWCRGIYRIEREVEFCSEADEALVNGVLHAAKSGWRKGLRLIDSLESEYLYEQREKKELNRKRRLEEAMRLIPELPEGFWAWADEREGSREYIFYDKKTERWACTACGKSCAERFLHRADGGEKVRHNDRVICPRCRRPVQAKKRQEQVKSVLPCMVLQNVNEKQSVARHMDVITVWSAGRKQVWLQENVRLVMFRNHPKLLCDIYWGQDPDVSDRPGWRQWFDNRHNPANRRMKTCFLYPEGIREALAGTAYEQWMAQFGQMAAAGRKLEYNRLMCAGSAGVRNTVEYLFKGRFYRLLQETTENITVWGSYLGELYVDGSTIEEVFRLRDRQKINRIRDCDGGGKMLDWMRWSEETGRKVSREDLDYVSREKLSSWDIAFIQDRMSLTQIIHYIQKQQQDGYKGKSAKTVLSQWADYLDMCGKAGRDVRDEMIYRPRELKRRHGELVEELRKRQMMEQMKRDQEAREREAERMREKFPGAEEILREIRPKYEYQSGDYRMIVPEGLVDIMAEGQALHHCAGASDRYFDRILQRETYICFLRKVQEPEVPYYTIEVEPGGTIRQHRGYMDEEPEIERIRPFLREWQREIKKRITAEDRRLAKQSAVKREENLKELREKNNTRVLQGLMEDFMEAV